MTDLTFSYSSLPECTQVSLREKAMCIRANLAGGRQAYLTAGQILLEAKEQLPHGQFMPWVEFEFGMGIDTAERMMGVARNPQLLDLPYDYDISILYLLSGAPPDASETLVEMSMQGKKVEVKDAMIVVAQSKFQAKVESIVAALNGAAPSEQALVEKTAFATLAEIQHGYDNPKLRDMARSLYDRYGARLNELARVVDNDMANTNNPNYIPAGNGNGTHIWTSLEEGPRNCQQIVAHVPNGSPEKPYKDFIIAIFPNVDHPGILPLQCRFQSAGAAAIGLRVPNLEGD